MTTASRAPACRAAVLVTALAIALSLGAAACDRDPEADQVIRLREQCAQLADSGAGLSEAARVLGDVQLERCAADLPPASEADRCPRDGTPVCLRVWAYRARAEALCGGTACSYGCELRAPQSAPESTCSVRFLNGLDPPELPQGQ